MPVTYHPEKGKKRVVILGAGFGGAYCAQALEKAASRLGLEVVLVDQRNYFIFYPLLVEAGTGGLEPRHAVVSVHDFVRKGQFIMAEVAAVRPEKREVELRMTGTDLTHRLAYDHLVVALGSTTKFPPIPGLREHAFELKSIGDSVAFRDRGLQMLEIANTLEDKELRRELLHFVVVGGSFTGVEIAGEFHAFLHEARRHFPGVERDDIQVTLCDFANRILPTLDEDLARYAHAQLEKRGVRILLKTTLEQLHERRAVLSNGETLRTRTVLWCAGIASPERVQEMPFEKDRNGYLLTERDLRLVGHADIWGIGDCALNLDPEGNPYPATAQHAIRQGKHAANNILRLLEGRGEALPCDIVAQGTLAAIGCRTAVAKVFGIKLSGFAAWFLWRTVYLMKMPTLMRKLRLATDWTVQLFFRRDIVQLGVHRIPRETPASPPQQGNPERETPEEYAADEVPEVEPGTGSAAGSSPGRSRS